MPLKQYDFQPGNGSRYEIIYGMVDDRYILIWMNRGGSGGSAFRFDGGYIHHSYMAEKMGLTEWSSDVFALCAFLNTQGHQAYIAEDYDSNGRYVKAV